MSDGAGPPPTLRQAVRWAAAAPLRARWPAARVRAGYCARSPRQVLAEGELSFTAPCADLSSLVAARLADEGLAATLVLAGIRRPLSHVKFQCGLEVALDGETWVVGFGVSSTYLYRGRFVETRRRPWVFRAAPARVDPDTPFLAHFEPDGRSGVARRVPGYDLERDLAWHARRQGWLRWALARRRAAAEGRAARRGRLPEAGGRWG
ncbi:MAG: hypothetical protein KF878_14410 [Planctomycetes bacterium]|nr:hypothetical protein [Planctomycetota bacterium]